MKKITGKARIQLDFVSVVKACFVFLNDLGFEEIESLSTLVRYQKDDIEVDVYHGRQSYEISFGVTRLGVRYSLSEFIRITDPEFEKQYRCPAATTQEVLVKSLASMTILVKRYCAQGLQGDPAIFLTLAKQRELWVKKYALDVLARQLRPRAHEAFRLGKYQEAAELYKQIQSLLSPAEIKKLILAEERS